MKKSVLAWCALLALSACSGHADFAASEWPAAGADEVPASAGASSEAYTAFVAELASSRAREPLQVNRLVPPTSETAEPAALR